MVLAILGVENMQDYQTILSSFFAGVPSSCKDIESFVRFFIGELYVEDVRTIKKDLKSLVLCEDYPNMDLENLESVLSNSLKRIKQAKIREHYKKSKLSFPEGELEEESKVAEPDSNIINMELNYFPGKAQMIKELKNCDKATKVQMLLEFHASNEVVQKILKKEMTSSMLKPGEKKWFHQTLQPLVECVQTHHNGNIMSFLDFHKDWTPSQISCGKSNKSCLNHGCVVSQGI